MGVGVVGMLGFPSKFSFKEIREYKQTKFVHFRSKFLRISMYFRPHFGENVSFSVNICTIFVR